MKKFIYFITLITVCISLVSCGTEPPVTNAGNKEPVSQTADISDGGLPEKLDEWVNIIQPGTAGSSMKAIAAVKDMITWAESCTPDKDAVAAAVKEYLDSCEYRDEATDAFISMKDIFDKITGGTITELIDGMEYDSADFETDAKSAENIRIVFDAIEEYTNRQEQ